MSALKLYAYGRYQADKVWSVSKNRVVNRLYYVNSGTAYIRNASKEYRLISGKIYIIPGSSDFLPLDAKGFDHTFFDYCSTRALRRNEITEIDASQLSVNKLFDYINALIENDTSWRLSSQMELFLSGLLSTLELFCGNDIHYIANPSVNSAVELIHSRYDSISTGQLAEILNLNESYFIRMFRREMGTSPLKYIRSLKALRGRELLECGLSVAEASYKCGYSSPISFNKAIRAEFSCSPLELKSSKIKV